MTRSPSSSSRSVASSQRHWLELLRRARGSDEPFSAAALYPDAGPQQRQLLEPRLFGARRDRLLLASAAFVAPAVLERLASVADDETLRVRLARNPSAPAEALGQVWRDGARARLAPLLARHPNTPREILAELGEATTDLDTLCALCENTGSSSDILATVEQRRIPVLQRLLAVNLATDGPTLMALWRATDEEAVRAQILLHQHCPDALLRALPASPLERRCIARHARTPPALLAELARDAEVAVRRATTANPATPVAAIVASCFDTDEAVRRTVAARRDLPITLAACLADDSDTWVRRVLARNPACPSYLLERSAADHDLEVRRSVARHPACPESLLDRLSRDAAPWVQAAVAYRDDLPPAVVRRLARSSDVDVLAGVGRNPETAASRLARLAVHECADVRRAVILNRQTPRAILRVLRQDPYPLHRALAVDHPNLADADRWRMRDDPDIQVRYRVYHHFARQLGPAADATGDAAMQHEQYPHAAQEKMETI
ncbi:hypothetical protein [Aromatoleum sp.]|uniref:hypothetical protein n=1 Tax=Aromatoleum sp. TaxID=2307007 RepID=UPI002FCCA7BA